MIVVVIIGLLAAMAIPAFQKVRQSSQDKAVLNNARQLAAAADQYFLEYGVSSVTHGSLAGATNYVKSLNLVANETYPDGYTQGITVTVDAVAGQQFAALHVLVAGLGAAARVDGDGSLPQVVHDGRHRRGVVLELRPLAVDAGFEDRHEIGRAHV